MIKGPPKRAYMGVVWVFTPEDEEIPYPLHSLYTDPNDFIHDALSIVKLPSYGKFITLSKTAILVPLTKVKTIAIKKRKPDRDVSLDGVTRLRAFLKLMKSPHDYHMLAVPSKFPGSKRFYAAAFPFLKEGQVQYADFFLQQANIEIDKSARFAGVYAPSDMIVIDLTTREVMRSAEQQAPN